MIASAYIKEKSHSPAVWTKMIILSKHVGVLLTVSSVSYTVFLRVTLVLFSVCKWLLSQGLF